MRQQGPGSGLSGLQPAYSVDVLVKDLNSSHFEIKEHTQQGIIRGQAL